MKNWPKIYFGIAMLMLVAACAPGASEQNAGEVTRYRFGSPIAVRSGIVYEFKLDDGTRCVMVNYTGIDCDWQQP